MEVFVSTFLRNLLYREGSKICLHLHHPLGCEKGRQKMLSRGGGGLKTSIPLELLHPLRGALVGWETPA